MKKSGSRKFLVYLISVMMLIVFAASQLYAWAGETDITVEAVAEETETAELPDAGLTDETTVSEDVQTEEGTEPESTEPESTEPEVTEPESTEPVSTEPETTGTEETTEPEATTAEEPVESVVIPEETEPEDEELTLAEIVTEETAAAETQTQAAEPATEKAAEPATAAQPVVEKNTSKQTDNENAAVVNDTPKSHNVTSLDTPVLVSAKSVENGVEITWEPVENAEWYHILYWNEEKKEYVKFAWTYDTSFVDTKAKSCVTYYYTVQAAAYGETKAKEDYVLSEYSYKGIKGRYLNGLAAPTLKSAVSTDEGVQITWKPVRGAGWYNILYWNEEKGEYVKFAWTYDTTYVDKKAKSGKMYYYTVQAAAYGETKAKSDYVLGDYNYSGIKGMYLSPVKSINAISYSNGVQLSWSGTKGADGYWLYWRKPGTTKWKYFKEVSDTQYYDGSAKPGQTYEYLAKPFATKKGTTFAGYYEDSYATTVTVEIAGSGDMNSKAQMYSSRTNWLIMVDCGENRFGVYNWQDGRWVLYKYWLCTTGSGGSPTCKGVYTINYKGYSFGTDSYTCYYFSSFNGDYLIHSTKFYPGTFTDKDNRLGMSLSGGCVRLHIDNAKWVYDYIPIGTTVVTYINW